MEFNYIVFVVIWSVPTFIIALALCLGMCIPKHSPLHANVGAAVGLFFAPWSVLGMVFTAVYGVAKQRNFLK